MVSKYDPLRRHLANSAAKTVFMTFAEIEKTLAFKLPKSARQYQAWWANASPNTGHPYSKAWTSTGRKASVNLLFSSGADLQARCSNKLRQPFVLSSFFLSDSDVNCH